jgi:hypothetical protein
LASRFAGSYSAECDGFLRAIKIRSKPYFGGKVKPLAPCRKVLLHVNKPFEGYFVRPNSSFYSQLFSCFATRLLLVVFPESSGGRIRSFPILIYHLGDKEYAVAGGSSKM